MRRILALVLIPFLVQGTTACDDAEDTGHDCDPGTHWDGSECVPDEDADTDTDVDTGPTDADGDGWTIAGGDCDDTDADVHPEAEEVPGDEVDQDCDGTEVCYQDGDADGYGTSTTLASTDLDCDDVGEASASTDCDDVDPAINPGAAEVCEDGIDQDCSGSDLRCEEWGEIDLSEADATLMGDEESREHAGYAISADDMDGDGQRDVVVGAWANMEYGGRNGAVYLVHGPHSGMMDLSDADAKMYGEGVYMGDAGVAVATGDTDGDGVQDIVIGAHCSDAGGVTSGAVIVVLGPVSGTFGLSEADALIVGEETGDWAGRAVAAGDMNDDDAEDVLVGAPDASMAYIVHGPVEGVVDLSEADVKFVGEEGTARAAGTSVLGGDVNGDGFQDFIVGDPFAGGIGAAYIVNGPVTGTVDHAAADATLVAERGYSVGYSFAVDDVDGDGFQDVLTGGERSGYSYMVLGPVMGEVALSLADAKFIGDCSYDSHGMMVETGDLDGDGTVDILIGAGSADGGDGVLSLVFGPVSGTLDLSLADASISGAGEDGNTGVSVVSGDMDNDGMDDILVGADHYHRGGAVFLFLGGGP